MELTEEHLRGYSFEGSVAFECGIQLIARAYPCEGRFEYLVVCAERSTISFSELSEALRHYNMLVDQELFGNSAFGRE